MKKDAVELHVGEKVYLNGIGDLAFSGELKPFLYYRGYENRYMTIVKLTRGGMVYLKGDDEKFYSVPPKNVDLWEDYIKNNQKIKTIN